MLNNSGNCREVCIHLILTEPLGQQEKRDSSPSSVIFLILQLMNDGQPARLGRSYSEGHLRTHLRINVAQQLYIKSKTASRHFNIVTAARDYPPHPRTSIGQPAGRLLKIPRPKYDVAYAGKWCLNVGRLSLGPSPCQDSGTNMPT